MAHLALSVSRAHCIARLLYRALNVSCAHCALLVSRSLCLALTVSCAHCALLVLRSLCSTCLALTVSCAQLQACRISRSAASVPHLALSVLFLSGLSPFPFDPAPGQGEGVLSPLPGSPIQLRRQYTEACQSQRPGTVRAGDRTLHHRRPPRKGRRGWSSQFY